MHNSGGFSCVKVKTLYEGRKKERIKSFDRVQSDFLSWDRANFPPALWTYTVRLLCDINPNHDEACLLLTSGHNEAFSHHKLIYSRKNN